MLSIIAVVINNLEITKRFVSSIRQYTTNDYELILIDNESTEEESINFTMQVADVYFRFDNRTDLAKAWNKGIDLSKGEYIAIVNNDTVVPPEWFKPLKQTLDNNESAGMVSPMTFWIIRDCYFKHHAYSHFDKMFSKPFKLEKFKEVMWGEFCVFKRKALMEVGGYCELYKEFSGEDLEMSFQLFSKGYDIYIDPRVFVYHEGHATLNTVNKGKVE
ncbi:MAG: glycosyltransferase family 2 protein, partial [Candidatus Hermodarchaeota archaeon]